MAYARLEPIWIFYGSKITVIPGSLVVRLATPASRYARTSLLTRRPWHMSRAREDSVPVTTERELAARPLGR